MTSTIPNVLAGRYASAAMTGIWSPEAKIVMERRLWLAVASAQVDLGLDIPCVRARRLPPGHRPGRSRLDRRARARHQARRQGPDRGVQRPCRARVRAPGDDLPRPHRERRAAAGARCDDGHPRPLRGRPGPAVGAGDRLLRHRDHRSFPQRPRADDHAGQAVRVGGRRAARRVHAARGADRPLPAPRHQGPRRHRAGHARPDGRGRGAPGPAGDGGGPAPRLHQRPRQRRAGLSAVARPRRRVRPRAGVGRSVQPGHDDPAHGRSRPRHGGLPARAGRVLGHAAQDELALVRTGQRLRGAAARLPHDGRRPLREPVERGRRLLLGRAPGRAARRVLRDRRAVRDLPHRPRRLRCLPGRDRP